jgi:hypothetical protein
VPQVREANLGLFAYTRDAVCAVPRNWPSTAAYCFRILFSPSVREMKLTAASAAEESGSLNVLYTDTDYSLLILFGRIAGVLAQDKLLYEVVGELAADVDEYVREDQSWSAIARRIVGVCEGSRNQTAANA